MEWILSADSKIYDYEKSFYDHNFIDWHQRFNFEEGDRVYIYTTSPYSKIEFVTLVERINMSFLEIRDDKEYWRDISKYAEVKKGNFVRLRLLRIIEGDSLSLNNLKNNGLSIAPRGAIRVVGKLKQYIDNILEANSDEKVDGVIRFLEGSKQPALISRYERNPIAREKCLDHYGYSCRICNFNFEDAYGPLGKEFIHVHHIFHLADRDEEYEVDPIEDLIPVCPNCHAMLHRKKENGKYLTVEELRNIVKQKK